MADYNKALELDPQHTSAYYNRGFLNFELEQYSQAIDDYNKVIEFNPYYAAAYYNRGVVYQALGKQKEADEDFATYKDLGGK